MPVSTFKINNRETTVVIQVVIKLNRRLQIIEIVSNAVVIKKRFSL